MPREYDENFSRKVSEGKLRSNPNNSNLELIAKIKLDKENGLTLRAISAKYGVDKSWVSRKLKN